jgi:glyoxylase-like metal-dependent hydrolase (beta-lactamase superfamily II)
MIRVRHINGGYLQAAGGPRAGCHCLLLEHSRGLALVDTGIGLRDIAEPLRRIGQAAIDAAGFQFEPENTLFRQLQAAGYRPGDVTDIVLTHADADHAGGLADFPQATVHVAQAELDAVRQDAAGARYSAAQFEHGPHWRPVAAFDGEWFGLPCATPDIGDGGEVRMVPLPGHTVGHCGVAVRAEGSWLLHVGDAYYLRVELDRDDHPVSALATMRAADDAKRRASIEALRAFRRAHGGEVAMFGYHDLSEMPAA